MNWSNWFPPEAVSWLLRYGLFTLMSVVLVLVLFGLTRPFWLWYTGRSEVLDRLRRLEEQSRRSLFELEMLNKTLSIPLKKAAKVSADRPEEPLVVTQETKDGFLQALARSRKEAP